MNSLEYMYTYTEPIYVWCNGVCAMYMYCVREVIGGEGGNELSRS